MSMQKHATYENSFKHDSEAISFGLAVLKMTESELVVSDRFFLEFVFDTIDESLP